MTTQPEIKIIEAQIKKQLQTIEAMLVSANAQKKIEINASLKSFIKEVGRLQSDFKQKTKKIFDNYELKNVRSDINK